MDAMGNLDGSKILIFPAGPLLIVVWWLFTVATDRGTDQHADPKD